MKHFLIPLILLISGAVVAADRSEGYEDGCRTGLNDAGYTAFTPRLNRPRYLTSRAYRDAWAYGQKACGSRHRHWAGLFPYEPDAYAPGDAYQPDNAYAAGDAYAPKYAPRP